MKKFSHDCLLFGFGLRRYHALLCHYVLFSFVFCLLQGVVLLQFNEVVSSQYLQCERSELISFLFGVWVGGWNEQVRRKQHRVSGAIPVLFPNNLFILIGLCGQAVKPVLCLYQDAVLHACVNLLLIPFAMMASISAFVLLAYLSASVLP